MSWAKLFPERSHEEARELTGTVHYTTTIAPRNENESWGRDFNLIRAVAEYGPQRIAAINKRLEAIDTEAKSLEDERTTLDALIAVVKPEA